MLRRWLPAIIFAVALFLRLFGFGWGLPSDTRMESLHPDEPIVLMFSKQVNPLGGDLDPGFYNYGTLYLSVSRLISGNSEFQPGAPAYRQDLLKGRLISVFSGAGIALLGFLILRPRVELLGAALGGLAVAFAPGLVVHSRFMTVDVFATFLVTLALYLGLKFFDSPAKPFGLAAGAGLVAGLAGGTKYNFVLVLIAILCAIGLSELAEKWKLMFTSFVTTVVGFLIGTPGVVLNPAKFRTDLAYEIQHVAEGHGLVFAGRPLGFFTHIGNLLEAFGGLSLIIGIAASIWAVSVARKNKELRWIIPGLVFALVYYILIGRAQVAFLRYVFPIIPVLGISIGWLVSECRRANTPQSRMVIGFGILSIGGFGGGGLASSVKLSSWMAGEDVRDQAGAWLRKNGTGKTVGLTSDPWFYSPTLYPQVQANRMLFMNAGREWMAAASNPAVTRGDRPWEERFDFDATLLDAKPDFITFSSFEAFDLGRLQKDKIAGFELQQSRYTEFSQRLESEYKLAQVFGMGGSTTHDMMYVRPIIFIYERK